MCLAAESVCRMRSQPGISRVLRLPGLLSSTPEIRELSSERELREFSTFGVYRLAELTVDALHAEAREGRREDAVAWFREVAVGFVRAEAGDERQALRQVAQGARVLERWLVR